MAVVLFATPSLDEAERRVLDEVEGRKDKLKLYLREPRRWHGSLRRLALARAIQGSNSVEGYAAALDDAAAVALGEERGNLDPDGSARLVEAVRLGLLVAHGQARGRIYTAGPELVRIRDAIVAQRDPRDDRDPFATAP
jgi:hypothetical protein